jgi:hypothetical protein
MASGSDMPSDATMNGRGTAGALLGYGYGSDGADPGIFRGGKEEERAKS